MANFSIAGTFTALPDPDYQSMGIPVRGGFIGGGLVRQGWESGVLKFPPLSSAMRNELVSRWEANKAGLVGGTLPKLSGTVGWGAVTAAWGQPVWTGFDGEWAHGGSMIVYRITRYGG
jgi:hypothetical protein